MCKILIVPNIKPNKYEALKKLSKKVASIFGRTEDDGIGYAAITNSGRIYGEKWLNTDDAFVLKENPNIPKNERLELFHSNFAKVAKFDTMPKQNDVIYSKFGATIQKGEYTTAFMLHARKKTQGDKSIVNTHPFAVTNEENAHDTAIIHNGSILNHEKFTKKMSTCDSEVILHEYIKYGMNYAPENIQNLSKEFIGEYAVGVLSSFVSDSGELIPIVDVFKSNKDLYVAFIRELDTFVFITSKYSLEEACRDLKFTIESIAEFKDGNYMRFNALTGELINDPVEFSLSSKFLTYTNNYNYNSRTVYDVKKEFEVNNEDLFMTPFYDSPRLTAEEKKTIQELEKTGDKTAIRALELVKKAVGYGNTN